VARAILLCLKVVCFVVPCIAVSVELGPSTLRAVVRELPIALFFHAFAATVVRWNCGRLGHRLCGSNLSSRVNAWNAVNFILVWAPLVYVGAHGRVKLGHSRANLRTIVCNAFHVVAFFCCAEGNNIKNIVAWNACNRRRCKIRKVLRAFKVLKVNFNLINRAIYTSVFVVNCVQSVARLRRHVKSVRQLQNFPSRPLPIIEGSLRQGIRVAIRFCCRNWQSKSNKHVMVLRHFVRNPAEVHGRFRDAYRPERDPIFVWLNVNFVDRNKTFSCSHGKLNFDRYVTIKFVPVVWCIVNVAWSYHIIPNRVQMIVVLHVKIPGECCRTFWQLFSKLVERKAFEVDHFAGIEHGQIYRQLDFCHWLVTYCYWNRLRPNGVAQIRDNQVS